MNKKITIFALMGIAMASCAAPQAPAPMAAAPAGAGATQNNNRCGAADEKRADDLFGSWNRALRADNNPQRAADIVLEQYDKDATLLPTLWGGPYEKIDKRFRGYFAEEFLPHKPEGTLVLGTRTLICRDNILIASGLYNFKYNDGSGGGARARYTFVYKREGNEGAILHHHSSALPAKNPPPVK